MHERDGVAAADHAEVSPGCGIRAARARRFGIAALTGAIVLVASVEARAQGTPAFSSPFWSALDDTCKAHDALATAGASADRSHETGRQVLAYCERTVVPRFAALEQRERMLQLNLLRAAMGLSDAAFLPVVTHRSHRLPLPLPKSDVPLRAVERELVRRSVAVVCASEAVRAFPATCALPIGDHAPTLAELARALLEDALAVARGTFGATAASTPEVAQAREILRAMAFLAGHTELVEIAEELPALAGPTAGCPSEPEATECDAQATALRATREILVRSLRDDPALGLPDLYYEYVVLDVLSGDPGVPWTPALEAESKPRVAAFLSALRSAAHERGKALRAADGERTLAAIEANARAILAAVELVPTVRPPRAAIAVRRALPILHAAYEGNVVAALRAVEPELEHAAAELGIPTMLPANSVALAEVASATTARDIRAAAFRLVGIGPWIDPWSLEAHATVPKLQSSDFLLNGDAALGYSERHFGGLGRGSLYSYELKNADGQMTRTERYAGSGEAFLMVRASDHWQLDLRAEGGGSQYTTLNLDSSGIGKQRSTIGYGGVLVGARVDPSADLSAALHVGVAVQAEQFKQTERTAGALSGALTGSGIGVDQSSPVTARGQLRLAGDWAAFPGLVSFRLRADALLMSLSRTDTTTTLTGAGVPSAATASSATQLEVYGRGYVVVDALGFLGFFPAVHAGANYVALTSGGSGDSVFVPVFGVGVRRETM